jgi:hypothetical protein
MTTPTERTPATHTSWRVVTTMRRVATTLCAIAALAASAAPAHAAGLTPSPAMPSPAMPSPATPSPFGPNSESSGAAMGAWNGQVLVTAQVNAEGDLYVYAQVPGASAWSSEKVALASGGVTYTEPWVVATATSVQIVALDSTGRIWFWQQVDGSKLWSKRELVGDVGSENLAASAPKIAWTGVPGHTGTNSVITAVNGNGDLMFWYQIGGEWSAAQTVADDTSYNNAALTATDDGIVIVAPEANGALRSFYQPYGGSGWTSGASLGVGTGQRFESVSVTWDGTNVDLIAGFDDSESTDPSGDTVLFAYKSDSDRYWSSSMYLTGLNYPTELHPLAGAPAIYETGGNLVVTAVQQMSSSKERLDYWWQGATFTNFNFEAVDTAMDPIAYSSSTVVSTTGTGGEVAIFAPVTTPSGKVDLDDWTQPVGETVWSDPQVIAP